jgi:hypothetical protein
MNQEKKQKISSKLKPVLKKYGLKGSLSVRNHMTLVLNVTAGSIDFVSNMNRVVGRQTFASDSIQVNQYWYHEHFDGVAKKALREIIDAMNTDNHDRSDIRSDYFDVGHYIDVNIGKWNKPYQVLT